MDVPERISLKVGEEYTIKLKSLRTAGYRWSAIVTGDKQAISVVEKTEAPRSVLGGRAPMAGESADEIFVFHGHEKGNATVQLVQRRAWETQKPPLKEFVVEISVTV